MINFRLLKLSDPWLWGSVSLLIVISFFAIFSSTFSMQAKIGADVFLFIKRQLFSLFIGLIGLSIFAYVDYKRLKRLSIYFYGAMLFFLFVILLGGAGGGAQRWLQIGPFSFQPSELSKIIIVICLAAYLSTREKLKSVQEYGILLAMVGIPFLLIFRQPDLGTALVFIFILIGMLAASGSSPKLLILMVTPMVSVLLRPFLFIWLLYLLAIIVVLFLTRATVWDWILILGINVLVGLALPLIWGILKTYQKTRILAFLNPALDPQGAGYHSLQSRIAIGSGGIFGKGFLHGTQTQLQFIPEQHSDFIFAAIGEEFGFIGTSFVLALYSAIVWRAMVIASAASDLFGKLLASGIAAMTSFHVFANVGMTLGILPVVGMPLPFLSFGGSSLMMNLMAVGILQSISMRQRKLIF